jgi:CubicO group peptidase (beta-lactamase class C family)
MHNHLRRLHVTALLAAAFTLGVMPASAQHFPDQAGLERIIRERVDAGLATGIVVGVIEADGTRKIAAYGNAGAGAQPLSAQSVFEIGSITKVFTGIILADMAAQGEVQLDDPAQKYAPEGMRIPGRGDRTIALLDLATHHSGLPRLPTNLAPADQTNPYADYTAARLREFLNGYTLPRDIDAIFEYSNLGTGLLGYLLAQRAGTDYETLVRRRILEPLGMSMSGITYSPEMRAQLAVGHNIAHRPVPGWDLDALAGAGALRSNVDDMLTFVDANMGPPKTALERAMRTSHEPRRSAGASMRVGLNWMIRTVGNDQVIWHNGGTGGYRSFIGFDPARNVGVVVLTNSAHGADDIGMHLVNNAMPLGPPRTPGSGRTAVTVAPEVLRTYVGTYELNPQFRIDVTLENGQLHVQPTGQPRFETRPESQTKFFLLEVDAQFTFIIENGAVVAMILHQGGSDARANRIR